MLKVFLIVNGIVGIIMLILAVELATRIKTRFRREYPNALLDVVPVKTRIITTIATIVKAFIPIYNIICVIGFLFLPERLCDNGYLQLVDRIIVK